MTPAPPPDDLTLMLLAWHAGRRDEALAMADRNRAAATIPLSKQPEQQTRKDAA